MVHHHHFDPLAGVERVSHLFSLQNDESLPLAVHVSQIPRPVSLQNHHTSLYISPLAAPPLRPPLVVVPLLTPDEDGRDELGAQAL